MFYAAAYGHLEIVNYLLRWGARGDTEDTEGQTALIWAAFSGHPEVIHTLLESTVHTGSRLKAPFSP